MHKAANAYMQTQVTTTTPGHLVVLLYDGAITFLEQAKGEIEAKNFAKKGILISQALDIIAELDGSLNADKGGEIARNLHKLYMYCSTRLLQANLKMDIDMVDEVIGILSSFRSAFSEISKNPAHQAPPRAAAYYAR
ncbi:flagellar protein FliS [Desulfomicrobium macestii]|uniref:Flagellar secretion chaperone FliS n=2 Tax=Desulfomicrobium TaxID=898 RepID=A0A8G2C1J4_DESNO|nr:MULTISPECIES: flagellar export chaperone FliS [Desulfomicrobium]MBE1424378.1 flagellar protein FliS [Desulfomicrobium macestii]SFL51510.1 flagellar protein FliS [Desulfomicrobium norvegicum]